MRTIRTASRVGIRVSFDVPKGFQVQERLAPGMSYPEEVAAITTKALPHAEPTTSAPRLDALGDDGAVVWLRAYDRELERRELELAPPDARDDLGVTADAGDDRRPLGADDVIEVNSWPVNAWTRLVSVTETKVLEVSAFSGHTAAAPSDAARNLISSLQVAPE